MGACHNTDHCLPRCAPHRALRRAPQRRRASARGEQGRKAVGERRKSLRTAGRGPQLSRASTARLRGLRLRLGCGAGPQGGRGRVGTSCSEPRFSGELIRAVRWRWPLNGLASGLGCGGRALTWPAPGSIEFEELTLSSFGISISRRGLEAGMGLSSFLGPRWVGMAVEEPGGALGLSCAAH